MKNILFIASEGVPFIKTGGLADVVGSLPKGIDKEYYDVRVILPKYNCISIIYAIPSIILYVLSQKYMSKGFAMEGGAKG